MYLKRIQYRQLLGIYTSGFWSPLSSRNLCRHWSDNNQILKSDINNIRYSLYYN